MELEKFYNYTIKNLVLSKFENMSNKFSVNVYLYFSKSYISLLGWILLNLISYNKVLLVLHFKGKNIGFIPIGVSFTNFPNVFIFIQKFLLFFLGGIRNLTTNYYNYFNKEIRYPLLGDLNDLIEYNSINSNLSEFNSDFYLFLNFKLNNSNEILLEFIIRLFRIPLISIK
jgi:hypothetical protein